MREVPPPIRARRLRALAAAAVTAVIVSGALAACSSSGTSTAASSGGSASSDSGASSSSGSGTVNIKFGDLSPNSTLTPFYVAVDQGFFAKHGLNVTVQKFSGGGATSVAALATGAVQVASGGPTNFIGDMAKKVISGKLFGMTVDAGYDLVTAKGITSISQLKGKNIGVSGINSSDYMFLAATLAHYGISVSDITFVTSGTTSERLIALSSGKINAIADQAAFRPSELAVGNVLLKVEDNPVRLPTVAFYADDSFIKSNPGALKKWIAAMIQAAAWAKQPANEATVVKDCETGSGSTAIQCQQTLAWAKSQHSTDPYTWSSTFGLDTKSLQAAISAVALVIPAAKSLTLADVADTTFAGTAP
jgi:ABC-type nitrate/sulfonate/bicarbonate transport system substrate-binding protein